MQNIKLIECPRDAMQGIRSFIPTAHKIRYIQSLLNVGFDTIDCGSFVSSKAVPQMADTAVVINALDVSKTMSKLLVIVANERGAAEACKHEKIYYLGYPFSISENFQMRNTHKTIAESFELLKTILRLLKKVEKKLVVYLSMGFGNPYGDPWNISIVSSWVKRLIDIGVRTISLSDTVGAAAIEDISLLYETLINEYPEVEFGAHFHTHPKSWYDKVNAAYMAGCMRFDGAVKGKGGCPMAQNAMVGNMPTEKLISYFAAQRCNTNINALAFETAYNKSHEIFV